jgi:hypothetical protein
MKRQRIQRDFRKGRAVLICLVGLWFGLGTAVAQSSKWTLPLDSLPQKSGYVPGSFRFDQYLSLLKTKRVALVVNHTARFQGRHLVDTLLASGVQIVRIFAPEHGFRGTVAAGETVKSGIDPGTGIPLVSLYGKNKKPGSEMLAGVDVVLFDIQDVGARFYTYISTMKLVMEACAENRKTFLLCDRANPLGFCTGGPILEKDLESFVGVFPIPVVHGLTVGELARMAVKRRWIKSGSRLKMKVIPCLGYNHSDTIFPETAPSPNLKTPLAILAYPSLCLFEGTNWSVGRGTAFPFQVFGFPDSSSGTFRFIPSRPDSSQPKPLYDGKVCFGTQLEIDSISSCFSLKFLISAWKRSGQNPTFFNSFFPKLAGVRNLEDRIRKGEDFPFDQNAWLKLRKDFLLYQE